MKSSLKEKFNLKNVLTITVIIIVGLIFLILSLTIENHYIKTICDDISSAFLITGVVSILYEIFLRNQFISIIENNSKSIISKITLSKNIDEMGVSNIIDNINDYNFKPLIEESKHLSIVLNDGRTWFSMHIDSFKIRFSDPSKSTHIYLLHPSSEKVLNIMSRKTGTNSKNLQLKIKESVKILNQIIKDETKLKISGHYLFNTFSLFLGDKYACISPYFTSRKRRLLPLIEIMKTSEKGLYDKLQEDIEELKEDSELIFDN